MFRLHYKIFCILLIFIFDFAFSSRVNAMSKYSKCGIENTGYLLNLKNEVINSISEKYTITIGTGDLYLQPDYILPKLCNWFRPGVGLDVGYSFYKNKYKYIRVNRIPNDVLAEIDSMLTDNHNQVSIFSKSFWKELAKLQSKGVDIGFLDNMNTNLSSDKVKVEGLTIFDEHLILFKILYGEQIVKHEGRHWDQMFFTSNDKFQLIDKNPLRSNSKLSNNCRSKLYRSSLELDALIVESQEFGNVGYLADSTLNLFDSKTKEKAYGYIMMDDLYYHSHLKYLNNNLDSILSSDCSIEIKEWFKNISLNIENKYRKIILETISTTQFNYLVPLYRFYIDYYLCKNASEVGNPLPKKCNQDFNLLRNKNIKLLEENIPLERQYVKKAVLFMEELSTSDTESLNNPMVIEAMSYTENLMLFVGGD